MNPEERDKEMERLHKQIDRSLNHAGYAAMVAVAAFIILIIVKVIKAIS